MIPVQSLLLMLSSVKTKIIDITSCTVFHPLPSPPAPSIALKQHPAAWRPRSNIRAGSAHQTPRGAVTCLCTSQISHQLSPTSQLHLLSFTCPAQRWHLPLGSSMGKVFLIMGFLHIKENFCSRLMMCQLLLQQILPALSQMASCFLWPALYATLCSCC